MLNFFKKPLGFAIIFLIYGLFSNLVSNILFPGNSDFTISSSMIAWTLFALYANIATLLLYRLLIKQEPFSKQFKKAASKLHAGLVMLQVMLYFISSKILYTFQPEIAEKLFSSKNFQLLSNPHSWALLVGVIIVVAVMYFPLYWLDYFLLWLTDKISDRFLKSNNE